MKARRIAWVIMAVTVLFVIVNTVLLGIFMNELYEILETVDFEQGSEEFFEAYDYYKRRAIFITLTVSHTDMHDIEQDFAEIIGCLETGDVGSASIVKSRLMSSVEHMRRLTGVNIESIV